MAEHPASEQTPAPARPVGRYLVLLLIAAGVLLVARRTLLLSGIPWSVMGALVLIGVGLDLVTGGRQRAKIVVGSILAVLVLGGLSAIATPAISRYASNDLITLHTPPVITDEQYIEAHVRLMAGNLSIEALPASTAEVARLEDGEDSPTYYKEGQHGVLQVQPSRWRPGDLELALTRHVPLRLELHISAGNAEPIDLTDLQIERLHLSVQAGNAEVILPASGSMEVNVDSFAGNVRLQVPDELPARIEVNRIGDLDIDDRFRRQGPEGVFVSDDYTPGAPDQAHIHITTKGGNVEIE